MHANIYTYIIILIFITISVTPSWSCIIQRFSLSGHKFTFLTPACDLIGFATKEQRHNCSCYLIYYYSSFVASNLQVCGLQLVNLRLLHAVININFSLSISFFFLTRLVAWSLQSQPA